MVTVGQAYAAEARDRRRQLGYEEKYTERWRVIFTGDSGVGKTSILSRFSANHFSKERSCGPQLQIRWIKQGDEVIKLEFWDTSDMERYDSLGRTYFRGVVGAFIVYDITNHLTFEHVGRWLQDIYRDPDHDVVTLLIGNKCDLSDERAVSTNEAKAFAEQNGLLFLEVSALDSTNINRAFQILTKEILQRRFCVSEEEIKFLEHMPWSQRSTAGWSDIKNLFLLFSQPDFLVIFGFLVCICAYFYLA